MVNINIFLAYTEYHILIANSIILDRYRESVNYIFYQQSNRIGSNLQSSFPFIVYRQIPEQYANNETLSKFLSLNPNHFFCFHSSGSDAIYVCYWMKLHNITVSLVQDGAVPYTIRHEKYKFLKVIKYTSLAYFTYLKRHLYINKLIPIGISDYGGYYFYDNIWLSYPESFSNKYHKKIIRIPDLTKEVLRETEKLFPYDYSAIDKYAVLIIGQPVMTESIDDDIEIISRIIDMVPDSKTILYKSHPKTQIEHMNKLRTLPRIQFIDGQYPAELLILQMKDTAIISGYSTALLTYNGISRYYWLYNLYRKNKLTSLFDMVNPTNFINVVHDFNEIVL